MKIMTIIIASLAFCSIAISSDFEPIQVGDILFIEDSIWGDGYAEGRCRLAIGDQLDIIDVRKDLYRGVFYPKKYSVRKGNLCGEKNWAVDLSRTAAMRQLDLKHFRLTLQKDLKTNQLFPEFNSIKAGDSIDSQYIAIHFDRLKRVQLLTSIRNHNRLLLAKERCQLPQKSHFKVLGFSQEQGSLEYRYRVPVIQLLAYRSPITQTSFPLCPIGSILYLPKQHFASINFRSLFDEYKRKKLWINDANSISPNKEVNPMPKRYDLTPGEVFVIPERFNRILLQVKRLHPSNRKRAFTDCRLIPKSQIQILGFSDQIKNKVLMKVLTTDNKNLSYPCAPKTLFFMDQLSLKIQLKKASKPQ